MANTFLSHFPLLSEACCWGAQPAPAPSPSLLPTKRLPALPTSAALCQRGQAQRRGSRAEQVSLPCCQCSPCALLSLQMWHTTQVASALPPASLLPPGFEPAAFAPLGGLVEPCPSKLQWQAGLQHGRADCTLGWPWWEHSSEPRTPLPHLPHWQQEKRTCDQAWG